MAFHIENGVLKEYTADPGVTDIVIPEGVIEINRFAFTGSDITSAVVPGSVKTIGHHAFCSCANLTSVTFLPGVEVLDNCVFQNSKNLKQVTLPDTVTAIGERVFDKCQSLCSVVIPEGITIVNEGLFQYCTELREVTLPESLIAIHTDAFKNCCNLTSVTIPAGVSEIEEKAFPPNVELDISPDNPHFSYQDHVLYDKKGNPLFSTSSVLPGVTEIKDFFFAERGDLTEFTVPDGVVSIGDRAFEDCSNLVSVTLPDSLVSIGKGAFRRCDRLRFCTLPKNLESVGEDAFRDCDLVAVSIPERMKMMEGSAFNGCDNLIEFYVSPNNPAFCSRDGVLYNKDGTTLLQYPAGKTDEWFTVPEGVKRIADEAFRSCSNLERIILPNSLESIGERAFYECEGLTELLVPANVTAIGQQAFDRCTHLVTVRLPDALTEISAYLFNGCVFLRNITLPPCLTMIGAGVFQGCTSIYRITVLEGVTEIGERAFGIFENALDMQITLPRSVTKIGDDALSRANLVYAPKDSYAAAYAKKNLIPCREF